MIMIQKAFTVVPNVLFQFQTIRLRFWRLHCVTRLDGTQQWLYIIYVGSPLTDDVGVLMREAGEDAADDEKWNRSQRNQTHR